MAYWYLHEGAFDVYMLCGGDELGHGNYKEYIVIVYVYRSHTNQRNDCVASIQHNRVDI